MPTPIEQNTTALQSILDAVNALPDASGGGGAAVETCTVELLMYNANVTFELYYTSPNMTISSLSVSQGDFEATLTVAKGTVIYGAHYYSQWSAYPPTITGDIIWASTDGPHGFAFIVNGDGTITNYE